MKENKKFIDEKIRDGMRIGKTVFYWSSEEWQELTNFFSANAPCIHGWSCLCDKGTEEYTKENCVEGMPFMGARHFILNSPFSGY